MGPGDGNERSAAERVGDVRLFDRFARLYDLKPPTARSRLRPALALAERDVERVLDVAGGTGQGVRALAVPESVVLDAAPGMLTRAQGHGLDALRGDAAALPLADGTFDAVLVLDALHHVARPGATLAEAARVLRPGGVLACLEFDPATIRGRLVAAGERLLGFDSTFFTPEELTEMIRETGLEAAIPRRGFEYTAAGVKQQ